jgi:hypothetical protein
MIWRNKKRRVKLTSCEKEKGDKRACMRCKAWVLYHVLFMALFKKRLESGARHFTFDNGTLSHRLHFFRASETDIVWCFYYVMNISCANRGMHLPEQEYAFGRNVVGHHPWHDTPLVVADCCIIVDILVLTLNRRFWLPLSSFLWHWCVECSDTAFVHTYTLQPPCPLVDS